VTDLVVNFISILYLQLLLLTPVCVWNPGHLFTRIFARGRHLFTCWITTWTFVHPYNCYPGHLFTRIFVAKITGEQMSGWTNVLIQCVCVVCESIEWIWSKIGLVVKHWTANPGLYINIWVSFSKEISPVFQCFALSLIKKTC